MEKNDFNTVVQQLCKNNSHNLVQHVSPHGEPMPSTEMLNKLVQTARSILFPGYFGNSALNPDTLNYYIGVSLDSLYKILKIQLKRGICFECRKKTPEQCRECDTEAERISSAFLHHLPHIRHMLTTDVIAAYEGDPAAKSHGEVIFCYPAIRALTNYRIAHELLKLGAPLIPRIITEMAHSETGIDIHPGAQIGEYFTIDHGTGVVIGETCIIGNHVKIYQGVTLGAKSFPVDENGNPIKGVPRHPIVEDHVVIYAEATILGRVTIGQNSVIGGNVWITRDLPPNSKILRND
jgi:serine O-acetyltransferase